MQSWKLLLVQTKVQNNPKWCFRYINKIFLQPQLITKHGYPVEIHRIITEDDYITEVYRIPSGKKSAKPGEKPVLFLHGQCGCSENFIVSGPNSSTAYYLADQGYDVWLVNNKGNRHGRRHKFKNPDKEKSFWNFG